MRRILSVKSQEELQSDIICLKRQLALALDENQLLKVKIRRLEDELRRKDKYIETFQADPQRFGRFAHEQSNTSLINKLQRRNQELEAMILERNLQDEKRCKDLKTMSLYSHNINCQASRKRTKSSLPNLAQLNFRPRSNSPSRRLLTKSNNCGPFEPQKSISFSSKSSDDCPNIQWGFENKSETSNALKGLELEKIVEEQLLRIKDAEISRLSSELKDIKNLLRKQERESPTKTIPSTQICKTPNLLDTSVSPVHTDFIEPNKTHASCHESNDRKSSRKSNDCPENEPQTHYNRLETLPEQNEEEICLSNHSKETSMDRYHEQTAGDRDSTRPKTRIEYVYDSEVSSDGEEFTLPSNLTSFLQQAVNTSSYGQKDDVNSD